MRILKLNIGLLFLIILCHFFIIRSNGQNSILFDILLLTGILSLIVLNIYSCYLLFKNLSLPIIIGLVLSVVYYLILFVLPIFQGSR